MSDEEKKKPVVIARVVAGKSGARTLGEFIEWRKREDERMETSMLEQREAWFALRAGATRH